jgi:outer membrane protein assembly factor BamB
VLFFREVAPVRRIVVVAVVAAVGSTTILGAQGPGWQAPFDAVNDLSVSDVIALGDDLVVGSGNDGALVAVGAAKGEQRWRFQIGTPEAASNIIVAGSGGMRSIHDAIAHRIILQAPAWHSGLVYVGSRHAKPKDLPNIYAVDGVSGKPRWSFFTPGGVFGPAALAGGRVILTGTRLVHALDAATGAERWSFEPLAGLHDAARRPPSSPVVDGESVYLTVWPFHQYDAPHHSYLFALDAATGRRHWTVDVAGNEVTRPVPYGDTVYFGVEEEAETVGVYAVNKATGLIKWKHTVESARGIRTLVARGDALYVDAEGVFSGKQKPIDRVLALDSGTGAVKWTLAGWLLAEPLPPGTPVYGKQKETVAALDPSTGRPERSIQVDDNSVVRFSDGQFLYVSAGKRVAAYEIATGKARWQRRLDSLVGTVLLKDRVLFVATRGASVFGGESKAGYIYRLDAATGKGV